MDLRQGSATLLINMETREENPFEDEEIASLWAASVEGEQGGMRDLHIYPTLQAWLKKGQYKTVLDIGCGQGIASTLVENAAYTGVEPSAPLVDRAKEKYGDRGDFIVGNAYALPFADATFDAAFSLNVWFHLKHLDSASREAARILKPNGKLFIVTANPDSYPFWQSLYKDVETFDGMFRGRAKIPLVTLPRNDFYTHHHATIVRALEMAGMTLTDIQNIATTKTSNGPIFRCYSAQKDRH